MRYQVGEHVRVRDGVHDTDRGVYGGRECRVEAVNGDGTLAVRVLMEEGSPLYPDGPPARTVTEGEVRYDPWQPGYDPGLDDAHLLSAAALAHAAPAVRGWFTGRPTPPL